MYCAARERCEDFWPSLAIALRQPLLCPCVTVVIETKAPGGIESRDDIMGKLVGRDVHETTVNVKGRNVRIPNFLVEAVRLPEALEETLNGSVKKPKEKKMKK